MPVFQGFREVVSEPLNHERGTGGQSRLAKMLDCSVRLVRYNLAGTVPIRRKDELAIRAVVLRCPPLNTLLEVTSPSVRRDQTRPRCEYQVHLAVLFSVVPEKPS